MATESSPSASALEHILKRVDQARERPGYAIVRIDARTREIVPGRAIVRQILGGSIESYELKLDTTVEIYDSVETLRIFGTREKATISFRISVTARAAEANDIVRVLASVAESPLERLMGIVRNAVKSVAERLGAQSPDGLIASIFADRDSWQRAMERMIAEKTGLETRFMFEGPSHEKSTWRVFTVRNHEMATRDAPHRLYPLVFTVTLEPHGGAVLDPLPPSEQSRIDRVRAIIGGQFPLEIRLYDLWFDKGRVEIALRTVLSQGLRSTGFSVADLVMEPIAAPIPREEQVRSKVIWSGNAGRNIEFNVEAVLRLNREKTGEFDKKNLPARQIWLRDAAANALGIAMHNRDFEDLNLEEQRAVEQTVVQILREAACEMGQDIEPVVAKVLLPESRWLSRATLEIPSTKYPTHNPSIDAEFSITVELSLRTLRGVIDWLRSSGSATGAVSDFSPLIRDEVVRIVTEAARVEMAKVEAQDYFSKWEPWALPVGALEPVSGDPYVKPRLVKAIKASVQQRLDTEHLNIELRRTDSAVDAIHKEINALNPIEVEVTGIKTAKSKGSADDMGVKLRARSMPPNADKYQDLIRSRGGKPFDITVIEASIISLVKQFLGHHKPSNIIKLEKGVLVRGTDGSSDFEELRDYLREGIENIHGFPIHLDHIDPILSARFETERKQHDAGVEQERQQIDVIVDHMKDLASDVDERRKRADQHIKQLNNELLNTPIAETERRNRLKREIDEYEQKRAEIGRVGVQRITEIEIPRPLSVVSTTKVSAPAEQSTPASVKQESAQREPNLDDGEDGGF